MFGPYLLTPDNVDLWVLQPTGTYALGSAMWKSLYPTRVGRSVGDLPGRLRDYLGQYPCFMVQFAEDAVAAYHQECELYHAYMPADNVLHPDKPPGYLGSCLICAA